MRRIDHGSAPMTQHTVRVPADVWEAALVVTDEQRTTISDVLRDALSDYVKAHKRKGRKRTAAAVGSR